MPSYTADEALIQEDSPSSSPPKESQRKTAKKKKSSKANKQKNESDVRDHTQEPSPVQEAEVSVSQAVVAGRMLPPGELTLLNRIPPSPPVGNNDLSPPPSPDLSPAIPPTSVLETIPVPSPLPHSNGLAIHSPTTCTTSLPAPGAATPESYGSNLAINYSSPRGNGSNHVSLSASPRQGGMQRLGSPAGQYGNITANIQQQQRDIIHGRDRKNSMPSQASRTPRFYEPPPPHMPQRHFSRVPDLDLGLGKAPENGAVPGSKGFFCGFGSLENTNSGATTTVNNLVLVGSAGGLDAYRVLRQRMDVVGRLEGLRGGVIGAKILPWTDRFDPFQELRPLIALTIHGATIGRQHSTSHDNRDEVSQSDTGGLDEKRHFQTTVEVYSLRTAQHVSTLFEGPLVTAEHPLDHPLFLPPAPVGEICVSAEGTFVTVASGKSGEIYIFTPYKHPAIGNQRAFRCIGKVWTTTKERSARPSSTTESKVEKQEEPQPGPRMAVYSLSSRWLAIVPPSVSSQQFTIDGSPVCSEYNPNPPGLSSVISPAAPLVNCETDAPKDDGMLNRVTRQAAQEVRKGAQWVGEQGAQAWKNYWNKPASSQQNGSTIAHKSSASEPQSAFPPTHGHSNTSAQFINEPACVSIIDLQRLLSFEEGKIKNALSPLATFEIGDGCSFVSFAPNGLTLLTTNNNGDTSTAWNLMEMTSGSATGVPQNGNNSMIQQSVGLIKRIARFPRLSPSIVVDVIWTVQGDRFAILTDKGTVHLHELSKPEFKLSSHQSPMSPPASRSGLPSPSTSPQADLPANGWMSNMRAGWQGLQSAAARTRSGSNGFALPTLSTLGNATATARYAGSRAVRNGLHRGFDMAAEGAHHIRHAEDNKIRLHPVHHGIGPGNVKWLSGRERGLVATITDGRVYLYSIKDISHVQGKKTVTSLAASKKHVADFNLQRICGDAIVPAIQGILDPAGPHASCSDQGPHGFWTLARSSNVRRPSTVGVRNSSSGAVTQDKETNPPYMPFHREPQVSLFVFNEKDSKDLAANLGVDNTEPWIFGLPLPSASKINCQQFDSDDDYGQGIADGELEGLMGKMEDLSAKPTIKSKGRKSRHAVEVDDDDLVEL